MPSEERKRGPPRKPRCGACEYFRALYATGRCDYAKADLRKSPGDMCYNPEHSFKMAREPSVPDYFQGEKRDAYLRAVGWQPRED